MSNIELLQAIIRLEVDSDFKLFMDEIARRREAAREDLEGASDPWLVGRAQGEARLGKDLINLVSSARPWLAKIRQHESRKGRPR